MRLMLLILFLFSFDAGAGDIYDSVTASFGKGATREEALSRARVWFQPQTPIEKANLGINEPASDDFKYDERVICEWNVEKKVQGASPKFICRLSEKESVKVKYAKRGESNPEVYSELMSSRLFRALGFGAERMYLVRLVRCFGCTSDPWLVLYQLHSRFETLRKGFLSQNGTNVNGERVYVPNYNKFEEFENVVIERKLEGMKIEAFENQGWSFEETSKISPSKGGASLAEVDALRLLSSFIQHADNKRDNQGLICLDKAPSDRCKTPFAFIKDLGSSFGSGFHGGSHHKADVEEWAKTAIWLEGCRVQVRTSARGGFDKTPISEEGRVFLVNLLNRLSDVQIRQLFEGGNVRDIKYGSDANRDVERWTQVFKTKRAELNNKRCR